MAATEENNFVEAMVEHGVPEKLRDAVVASGYTTAHKLTIISLNDFIRFRRDFWIN